MLPELDAGGGWEFHDVPGQGAILTRRMYRRQLAVCVRVPCGLKPVVDTGHDHREVVTVAAVELEFLADSRSQ